MGPAEGRGAQRALPGPRSGRGRVHSAPVRLADADTGDVPSPHDQDPGPPPGAAWEGPGVHCPFCRHADSRVVDSRTTEDGSSIRRRRQCPNCSKRFTTLETASLSVVKRSGAAEPFSRAKIASGVRKACQGRPVSEDDIALLAHRVEEAVRAQGAAEIDAHQVGLATLPFLRELDEVAYLRFASVYQAFDSLADFEAAIEQLRAERLAQLERTTG
ncbi:transcriptional regulator NrdR [Paenibacillus sp. TRM 82003]|nr:transcriptional regulator NrdR [Paenibacillus sp. TRM 82003]